MFKIGDYLVCGKDVCRIMQIKEKCYNDTDYYILSQVDDSSLTRELPVNSDKLRPLISKKQTNTLINTISSLPLIEFVNDRMVENQYRKYLESGDHEDLMKIIKTSYLRIEEKLSNDKKASARDENYLKIAENYLYTELSVVLNMSYDDIKEMIISKILQKA